MDQQTITMPCLRCRKYYRVLEMVMDKNGKGMSCRACAGLEKPKAAAPAAPQTIRERFAKPSKSTSGGKYACENCKYRFTSAKPFDQINCPYCGGRHITKPEHMSADSLIGQSTKKDYDY